MNIITKIHYYLIWRKAGLSKKQIKGRFDMYRDAERYMLGRK